MDFATTKNKQCYNVHYNEYIKFSKISSNTLLITMWQGK